MASVSLQPRQKRDLWFRVMTEAKRGAFWPRFNMPRFLNRSRISKITRAKRGYCTSVTHMIDNHIMHYSLCNILYLLFDFISFLGYHVVSINRTGSINNKTHIQTKVAPALSFSILPILCLSLITFIL